MDKKRLRICFLSRYVGVVDRGVETYVLELAKRLSIDYSVEVLTGNEADSFLKLVQENYDIIIPTNGRLQSFKASFARLFTKSKIIIPGQAGIGRDDIWNILMTFPDIYVALTDYEMHWAKKWTWFTRVIKIPNGVDLAKFSAKGKKLDLKLPRPLYLSVGALEWYKHHELSIEAVAALKKGSLVIVGNGSEKENLQNLGEQLLGKERFKILNSSHDQIVEYYRAGDVFLLPSWTRESFGIVYVEAMACGLPVVAPNDLPRHEIIGEAGILVDVNNISEYADALEKCAKKNWKDIPQQQARKFSWDKVANQYRELFKQLL